MDASVEFLLGNLKELVIYHSDLIHDARKDVFELTEQVSLLKALFEDASKKRKDETFKILDAKVKAVVYEAEDIVESFNTRAAAQRSRRWCLRLLIPVHGTTSLEVKKFMDNKLKPMIHEFREWLIGYPTLTDEELYTGNRGQMMELSRNKAPPYDTVVGLEDDFETLVSRLNQESDGLEVIPITGMPGIGKTTMAWKIYHCNEIMYEFPIRIWVNVSEDLNIKDVCLGIMKKFTSQDFSRMTADELMSVVHEYLQTGKFLLVIDDLWTGDAWNQIRHVLSRSNRMGKVLITTSLENVASLANRKPHKLRFLNPKESWELLQLQVFGETNNYPLELEGVGNVIAARCKGLPLSIVVIGGVLGGTSAAKREWESISNNLSHYLFDANQEVSKNNIISLSYSSMSNELKDCFLYLGVFPEDTEIPVWKLTQLWIAEGFIRQYTQRSLEETAKEVLKDLINRNLLMVQEISINGEVKSCRVHDMIREFCRREANVENQGLFQEIRTSDHGSSFEPPISNSYSFRRLCIHSHVLDFLRKNPKLGKARSFLCFSKESYTLNPKDVSGFTDALTMVRVLEANTIKFPKFPTSLLNLRYITLSGDELVHLPEAISKLWNLQTLVVSTSSRTLEIKANIWKMMHLRHLKTKASIFLKAGKGEGGGDLQTLTRLSPKSCTADVVRKAKNLKKLGVRGKLSESMSFGKFDSLEKLTLEHDVHPEAQSEKPLNRLPSPFDFPARLRCLVLSGTYLEWNHISKLGQINTLKVLKLKDNAFTGSNWDVGDGDFRYLEALSIERANLMYWIASSDSFNSLRTVKLKNCTQLVQIPLELEKTLEELYMAGVTKYAVSYAKKIEEKKKGHKSGFKLEIAPGEL